MKGKRIVVGTLMLVCLSPLFTMYPSTDIWAMNDKEGVPILRAGSSELFKPDFARDKVGAEKWAKEHYKKWGNLLKNSDEKVINELKEPADSKIYDINETLKKTGGDIYRLPNMKDEEKEIIKKYEDDLKRIDRVLRLEEGKLVNKTYIYKDMKLPTFNEVPEKDFKDPFNPNKLDMIKVQKLKNYFEYGIFSDYLIGNLSEREGGDSGLLKWRIELPAGTNSGYLGEDQLFLKMNTAVEIKDVKVINQKGKEYIRIEAKIVPLGDIDAKVYREELKLQESWNSRLNIDSTKKFIQLQLDGRFASSITGGVDHLIQVLWNQVPQNLVQKVTNSMSEVGGKIVFTDTSLSYMQDAIFPQFQTANNVDFFKDIKGVYNPFNRTMVYDGVSGTGNEDAEGKKKDVYGMDVETFIHEFGHAVDYFYGDGNRHNPKAASDTGKFQEIFKKEGNNLTEYGNNDSGEFFAEAFRMMFSSDSRDKEKVETKAPETFKFINKLIQEVLDFSSNIDEARKYGEENYKDWQANLLKTEKEAITAYTGAKYDPINQYLRDNKGVLKDGEKLNASIKQIDSGLEKTVTPKPITVYKRVSEGVFNRQYGELRSLQAPYAINDAVFQKIKEEFNNKEFIGHGFESTSLAKDPSKSYSNDRYPILYKITVPEGIHGAFIEPISKYNDQLEFLIARGYTYKLNSFSIINTEDKPYVQVDVSIVKN